MPAGRKPKPNEIKRRNGNPGQRKLPNLENVIALTQISEAPIQLSDTGKKLWLEIREMAPWVAVSDAKLLIELCEKMDRKYELREQLSTSQFVLYTDKGYAYANPLFSMLNTVENDIVKLFSLLGLTPTDRTRLGVAEVKARGALEDLLSKRKTK